MGYKFCESDFDCLNGLVDETNCQKAKIESLYKTIESQEKTLGRFSEPYNAEIERLIVELTGMRGACESYKMHYDKAQAEIKEKNEIINAQADKIRLLEQSLLDKHAEIERLKEKYSGMKFNLEAVLAERADHTEAIKEFAERLKEKGDYYSDLLFKAVDVDEIDSLVKEMTEEKQ
jgi:chromosome segregation ATPase